MKQIFKNYFRILLNSNNTARYLIPPILYRSFIILRDSVFPSFKERLRKRQLSKRTLFDGFDEIFKKEIQKIEVYGEIGCGQSTCYAASLKNIRTIYSVDSSKEWLSSIRTEIRFEQLFLIHVDLGNLGDWGRPLGYEKIENVELYAKSVLLQKRKPQLILIDGRFRVFCFLQILINCDYDLKIIFDDYLEDREYYKVVEKIITPTMNNGRQALFELNENFRNSSRIEDAKKMVEYFRYVMD